MIPPLIRLTVTPKFNNLTSYLYLNKFTNFLNSPIKILHAVWNYNTEKDSVLRVTRDAYLTCNTTDSIASYKNSSTVVPLNHSGAYYFISGNSDNCLKGEKVIVVVMSERHSLQKYLAPAPAPESITDFRAPALAPMTGAQDRVVIRGVMGLMLGVGLLALQF
jgi:Plastocyanin-like domain